MDQVLIRNLDDDVIAHKAEDPVRKMRGHCP